jgi:lauroyl/myristoyl acyltransferase
MTRNPLYCLRAFKAGLWIARRLPGPLRHEIGAAIARFSYALDFHRQGALRKNLSLVTKKSGDELQYLCRRNVSNFGRMLADYFYTAGNQPDVVLSLLEQWRGYENIERARAGGKGVIVVTAHLGNWELGGLILASAGLPLSIVTLREPSTELSKWRENYRKELGIRTITVGEDRFAFVEMMSALRQNEFVAMLVDRPYDGSGIPVRFFGRETLFSSGPALLWQHTDAAVMPAFVLQRASGRYLSVADPIVNLEKTGNRDADIASNTQRIASVFETVIRKHPDQWYNYVSIWHS